MASNFFLRYPEGRAHAMTFSYDDGLPADKRLIEIFDKAHFRATFNVNSRIAAKEDAAPYDPSRVTRGNMWARLKKSEMLALYKNSGHEIACHGAYHWSEDDLCDGDIAAEIITDRQCHERDYGTIVRGHAYPNGSYSERVATLLPRLGIAYARTTATTGKFTLPKNFHLWDATCRHADPHLPELTEAFMGTPVGIREDGRLFFIWGHSSEFEVAKNWDVIETLAEKLGKRDDEIWYATNIDVCDYINAYRSLLFSLDHDRVYNPTAHKVWFEAAGRVWSVAPGETLEIR